MLSTVVLSNENQTCRGGGGCHGKWIYSIFWSNENNEPIHVHVTKGKPTPNATKIWLTKSGGCIVASNGSKISNKNQRLGIT